MALIAAQMYTLRDFCKTPADIAASCARVKKMGYDGVQLSGIGPIEPEEMRKILDGEGLQCVATHIGLEEMENDTEKVIARNLLWGCPRTAIGGFFPGDNWTREVWENFVKRFNALAKKFSGSGVQLGYHNHSQEFAMADDIKPLDFLIANLDPEIWMEIDTYWVAHAGADPADYIERCTGRIPLIHFKDMKITNKREHYMAEIGDGNLNWARILPACVKAGVQWYAVERDAGPVEPFESLQRSIDNMRGKMGM